MIVCKSPAEIERMRAANQLVADVLALHRQILQRWLQTHYGSFRSELSDLTVIRQGVPFEAVFTQIWHDIFGLTT